MLDICHPAERHSAALPAPRLRQSRRDAVRAMGRGCQGDKGDVTALPMKVVHHQLPPLSGAGNRQATDIKLKAAPSRSTNSTRRRRSASPPSRCSSARTFLKLARNPQAEELEYDKGPRQRGRRRHHAEVVAKFAELGAEWIRSTGHCTSCSTRSRATSNCSNLYTKILPARDGKIRSTPTPLLRSHRRRV